MTKNSTLRVPDRCRLILTIEADQAKKIDTDFLSTILSSGDVASIIFSPGTLDELAWQPIVEPLVNVTQAAGVAAIVAGYSRIAGRVGADGLQLGQDPDAIAEAIGKYSPKLMVGAANVKSRHTALVIGEMQPDYLMFGKPGNDTRAEPHPKNLDLGAWWSDMVEIPAITLGGNVVESVVDVAKTGVDFVALGAAIFAPNLGGIDITDSVYCIKQANQLLDEHAPKFENIDL